MKFTSKKFVNDLYEKNINNIDLYFKTEENNTLDLLLFSMAFSNEKILHHILDNCINFDLFISNHNLDNFIQKILLIKCYDNLYIFIKKGYNIRKINYDFIFKNCMDNFPTSEKLVKYLYFYDIFTYDQIYDYFKNSRYSYTSRSKDKFHDCIDNYLKRMKKYSKWIKYRNLLLIKKRFSDYIKYKKKIKNSHLLSVFGNEDIIRFIAKFI